MTEIGTLLRARRKAARMSIVALAGATDGDPSRIGAIERGEAVPTMYECHALEQALPTCSPQELGRLQYGDEYRGFWGSTRNNGEGHQLWRRAAHTRGYAWTGGITRIDTGLAGIADFGRRTPSCSRPGGFKGWPRQVG